MEKAEKLNMTKHGEFAFIFLDLYNSNTSYYWTDYDDHVEQSTGNPDNSTYGSKQKYYSLLRYNTSYSN